MDLEVTRVFKKGNKNYAFEVNNGQTVVQVDKAGMISAINSGHTFKNATVNVQSGNVTVNRDVPREPLKVQEVRVINKLAPNRDSKPVIFLVSVDGKTKTISVKEYETLLHNSGYVVKMGGKTTYLNKLKRNIFNSVWFRGDVSQQSLDAMVACLALAWGNSAWAYMNGLEKSLKANNPNGIRCHKYCFSRI